MEIIRSISIFIVAGICEIGGGYLVWLSVREGKPVWYGIIGGAILVLYGLVATLQASNFAKVYATYGGFFIVLSLLWAFVFDKYVPTKYDVIGALIALLGVCIIYYSPRS
ncbi:YnfA family protein [Dysgonomonas sp. 521]|uniref:YnfA family protein n=1 Tax=Dysgonomonas sp. 521 TaxID=2302932 RepID=UPI0013D828C4|nr:YnfA family protein [Dysgonomonas sp. 521]NDV93564.1 YnfA family protein [Dysgonomonas sp. 521]